ncbi:MAG: DUF4421 family protein [Silvanigrellaceae bacterium]
MKRISGIFLFAFCFPALSVAQSNEEKTKKNFQEDKSGLTTTLFAEGGAINVSFSEDGDTSSSSNSKSKIDYKGGSAIDFGLEVAFKGVGGSLKFASSGQKITTSAGRKPLSDYMKSSGTFLNLNYRMGQYFFYGMYGTQKGFYVDRIGEVEATSLTSAERFHDSLSLKQIVGSVYYFFNDKFDIDTIVKSGVRQETSEGSFFVYGSYDDIDFSAEREFLPIAFRERWESINTVRGVTVQSLTANGGYIYTFRSGPFSLTGGGGAGYGAGKVSVATTNNAFSRGEGAQEPIIHVNVVFGSEYRLDNSFFGTRLIAEGPSIALNKMVSVSFPLMSIKLFYGMDF